MLFWKRIPFILLFFVGSHFSEGQVEELNNSGKSLKYIGIVVGKASQKTFPFTDDEYVYSATHIKLQYNQKLWDWGSWDAHVLVEPGFYKVDHQLLNLFFITPEDNNYLERRERFLKPRTFNEYALNIGLRVSRNIFNHLDVYGLASSGPMYSEQSTERLKGGFAFSNVFGVGVQYLFAKNWRWDARVILRHTSNAGLRWPNSGHNSFGGETGILYVFN
ncbi:MAG: acyloxyacyl hydrolase [Nonlabens sp.]